MKKLYLIGGTMGVGKTSVCQILKKKLIRAVFLDGDWCWDADPFQVNDETKAMVVDNILHVLSNFIRCTTYDNVIFCWVMHEQSIIDNILSGLDLTDCEVKVLSLTCRKDALLERLDKDIALGLRQPDVVAQSLARLPLYDKLNTVRIDVSDISAGDAASIIAAL